MLTQVPVRQNKKKIVALTLVDPYPIGGSSAFIHSFDKYLRPIKLINAHKPKIQRRNWLKVCNFSNDNLVDNTRES